MMNFIRKFFCRHDWARKFSEGTFTVKCLKCGKEEVLWSNEHWDKTNIKKPTTFMKEKEK